MKKVLKGLILSMGVLMLLFTGCSSEEPAISMGEDRYHYDSDVVDLQELKEDIPKKDIIFSGESHGISENYIIKKELIMFIKENGGFKYLLSESSPADAFIINEYLRTGDITGIDKMYANLKGTFSWNKEAYEFIQWLYEYNETLEEDERIVMVGSDIVHQFDTGLDMIKSLLKRNEVEASIEDDVNEILKVNLFKSGAQGQLSDITGRILKEIDSDEVRFLEHYGEDFLDIYTILKGLNLGIEAYTNGVADFDDFTKYRDKAMYEIFDVQYRYLQKGRFYGQWGDAHTYTANPTDTEWFGAFLNSDERFKGKISSIHIMYDNCKRMGKKNGGYTTRKFDTFKETRDVFKNEMNRAYTLYKLESHSSIFNEELAFDFNEYRKPTEGVTTDYIQYFIRIDGGTPTKPLK